MWEKIKSLILNKEKRLPPLWWINQKFWSLRMKCSLHWRLYRSQFWVLGGLSKYFNAVLSLQSCKRKRPNWPFLFFFWGPTLIAMQDSYNGTVWWKHYGLSVITAFTCPWTLYFDITANKILSGRVMIWLSQNPRGWGWEKTKMCKTEFHISP